MLGICCLPPELLRTILLHVHPNDLITLASVNRHLRRSIPTCVDYALARRHVLVVNHHLDLLRLIWHVRYDHPLLFKHTVAEFAVGGISRRVATNVWCLSWSLIPSDREKEQAIWLNRVNALRESIERREWAIPESEDGRLGLTDLQVTTVADAVKMAAIMWSMDLLDALRDAFPDNISYDPECVLFRKFLFASALEGFCDGLELIPSNRDILNVFDEEEDACLLQLACRFGHVPAIELLIQKGASVNLSPGETNVEPILFSHIANDQVSVLRVLLQHGADINIRSSRHDQTALHRVLH
ncbi:hypothetical protein HDU96_007757, partial [Phlyctochytrium bullatum]